MSTCVLRCLVRTQSIPSDYLGWLSERSGEVHLDRGYLNEKLGESGKDGLWLPDCCAYAGEYGLPSVLVLRPVHATDWVRYNDAIDYAEEALLRQRLGKDAGDETMACRVELLEYGFYPYHNFYMDARSGRALGREALMWRRTHNASVKVKFKEQVLDDIARALGFADDADAQAHIVPAVPEDIRDLALYTELFTDESVYLQLRPMLYTHWS